MQHLDSWLYSYKGHHNVALYLQTFQHSSNCGSLIVHALLIMHVLYCVLPLLYKHYTICLFGHIVYDYALIICILQTLFLLLYSSYCISCLCSYMLIDS